LVDFRPCLFDPRAQMAGFGAFQPIMAGCHSAGFAPKQSLSDAGSNACRMAWDPARISWACGVAQPSKSQISSNLHNGTMVYSSW